MEIALAVIFWISGALLLLNAVKGALGLAALPDLAPLEGDTARGAPSGQPDVSILIPARNEGARIEETLRRALAQTGVSIEVIAIDDRSDDATGAVMDQLHAECGGRLTVLHIEELPDRWLGKCHALHEGSKRARGTWLLFMDADTWASPDAVARALQEAMRRQADHIALVPGLKSATTLSRAALMLSFMGLLDRAALVNWRLSKRSFIGVGAFNMVRSDLYRSFGGHEPLRMEVIDDLKLGLLVNRAGGRTYLLGAFRDLEVDYGASIPDLLHVIEKNIFAMLYFSRLMAVSAGVVVLIAFLAALFGFASGTLGGWFATAALVAHAPPAALLARRLGWNPLVGLLAPFFFPIIVVGVARSAGLTLRQRGVTWRGTHYPLEELRKGLVR